MIRRKQSCCFELHCSTTPLLQFLIMHLPSLIEKKRDGGELSSEEIAQVISGFTRGEIPDYQMSALAMAIFFPRHERQGDLAFDQSNAGERPRYSSIHQ